MMVGKQIDEPPESDPVAQQIVEDERRRSGAFLRDYLARHRIDLADDGVDRDPLEPGGDAAR